MKIILLDIDGVLAPLGIVTNEYETVDLGGWSTIAISKDNLQFLADIIYKANVVWSSSWEEISNNICEKFGLANLEHLYIGNANHEYWNKLPAMIDFIEENFDTEILIIDDEVDDKCKDILYKYDNVSILETDSVIGLTLEDKDFINEWIDDK